MIKRTKEELLKERIKIKELYLKGTSASELSRRSIEFFNRKLSVTSITTKLKQNGVKVVIKPWSKGLTKNTSESIRKRLESFHSNAENHTNYGQPCKPETRLKISNSRKEYLKANPDKVGYLLNHSSKESYPEKYFNDLFISKGYNFNRYYRIGLYTLDFCDVINKIDIEVDGNTHSLEEVKQKDLRRDKQLNDMGWTVKRINWALYQKYSIIQKEEFIKQFLKDLKL